MISRQAAIDAIHCDITVTGKENAETVARTIGEFVDRIKALTTVQPENIRCRDCKYRDPEDKKCDCGHDIRWQLPRHDDWYCADAERIIDDKTNKGSSC